MGSSLGLLSSESVNLVDRGQGRAGGPHWIPLLPAGVRHLKLPHHPDTRWRHWARQSMRSCRVTGCDSILQCVAFSVNSVLVGQVMRVTGGCALDGNFWWLEWPFCPLLLPHEFCVIYTAAILHRQLKVVVAFGKSSRGCRTTYFRELDHHQCSCVSWQYAADIAQQSS